MQHDDYRAALAIRNTPKLGSRTWKKLALAYPSLTEAARDAGAWAARGLTSKVVADAFRERQWQAEAEAEYEAARQQNVKAVLFGQPEYPPLLAAIPDPPLILYYRGRLSLAMGPCVAVVGTRQPSEYGLEMTRGFARAFSRAGVTVASGLAMGIDREAHLGGLEGPGSTVAVLGSGLGHVTPPINRQLCERVACEGLVLSELAPHLPPSPHTFPQRNRIISGISLAVTVTEAGVKSGALITARQGMEQGKEVFAMPGDIHRSTFAGCHHLLSQGAGLLSDPECVLDALSPQLEAALEQYGSNEDRKERLECAEHKLQLRSGLPLGPSDEASASPPPVAPESLGHEEACLLSLLSTGDKVHIDALGRASELDGPTVSRTLLTLELQGLVRKWPGMYYSRIS